MPDHDDPAAPGTAFDDIADGEMIAGRYRLLARRGRRSDVAVFEALDELLDEPVAVRLVAPEWCRGSDLADRCLEALTAFAAMPAHPNIASVVEVGAVDWRGTQVPFVAGELMTGGSLRDMLDRGRTLTLSQVVLVGLQACAGLDALHRAGITHGAIRPSNILFGADGQVRLGDVGLGALLAAEQAARGGGLTLDAARYATPEQATGQSVGPAGDVYALALCLWEAATGDVPFAAESATATLANRVDRLLPVSADLGPLAAVLERSARPVPEDRWSAGEFGRALVQAAERLARPEPLPLATGPVRPDESAGDVRSADEPVMPASESPARGASQPAPSASDVSSGSSGVAFDLAARPGDGSGGGGDGSGVVRAARPATGEPGAWQSLTGSSTTEPLGEPATMQPGSDRADDAVERDRVEDSTALEPVPVIARAWWRRRGAMVAVALLAVAAVVVVGVLLTRPARNDVPVLAGLTEGEALNQVTGFDWEVVTVEQFDEAAPVGVVVASDPAAGVSLAAGSTLLVTVSAGPAPRELPELTGLDVATAETLLVERGLVMQLADEPFDESAPPGTVLGWSVPDQPGLVAGDTVVRATVVSVIVSAGPAPRLVPDLAGFTVVDAAAALEELGLVMSQLPDEFSATVPIGSVVRTDPPVGAQVERGATVTIVLSKGPDLVEIPPLAALSVEQAQAALASVGLVLGQVKGDPAGVVVLAEANGQVLAAYAQLPRGSAVDITCMRPVPPGT